MPYKLVVLVFQANSNHEIVRDAYIYGYPLVTFDLAHWQQTNVERPDDQHARWVR